MSGLYQLKRKLQRKLPKSMQNRFQEMIYVLLYRFSPARKQNFFNSGYAPANAFCRETPPFSNEPLQATLYDHLLECLSDACENAPDRLLDIGSGLGGGVRLGAVRFPCAQVVGVEVNATAVRVARSRLQDVPTASFEQGDARALPFPDAGFDAIFSVGAASYIGLDEYYREAARLLKPGGTMVFSAGYTDARLENHRRKNESLAKKNGLVLHTFEDITPHVFAAIGEDVPRRKALIDRVPRPFRGYALNWADMPGTMRYQEYEDGRRLDYFVVCTKPKSAKGSNAM
ncbi:class I SAM-dependent methyltransferase [Stappia stellulata]|uniref:class I SAM-dependent methyltransferase n=1 Tax=Stappia stellulata TaxID=71235 RepID=UPI00040B14FC|nr:class I SAM-dependent methyltransferase [Stappia stellulata]